MVHSSDSYLSHKASVFDATAEALTSNATIDHNRVFESSRHRVALFPHRAVYLDPSAPDYHDVLMAPGEVLAADEILGMRRPSALKIPLKTRAEFEADPEIPGSLPSSDLLRALHYYAMSYKFQEATLDETALLALGSAVESWADEMIDAHQGVFLDENGAENGENGGSDWDAADPEEDVESEHMPILTKPAVMELELSESDTCSEVERSLKKRKLDLSRVGSGESDYGDSSSDDSSDGSSDGSSDSSSDSSSRDSIENGSSEDSSDSEEESEKNDSEKVVSEQNATSHSAAENFSKESDSEENLSEDHVSEKNAEENDSEEMTSGESSDGDGFAKDISEENLSEKNQANASESIDEESSGTENASDEQVEGSVIDKSGIGESSESSAESIRESDSKKSAEEHQNGKEDKENVSMNVEVKVNDKEGNIQESSGENSVSKK